MNFLKIEDWRTSDPDAYLYVTKIGIDGDKLFVEIAPNPNYELKRKDVDFYKQIFNKVDTLCIRGGGRYGAVDARSLLMQNTIWEEYQEHD